MRIHSYSLIRDVVAMQQRPRIPQAMWLGPPLVVMNNFGGEEQMKLAAITFQNLFPAINVQTTRLGACQVCCGSPYPSSTIVAGWCLQRLRLESSCSIGTCNCINCPALLPLAA